MNFGRTPNLGPPWDAMSAAAGCRPPSARTHLPSACRRKKREQELGPSRLGFDLPPRPNIGGQLREGAAEPDRTSTKDEQHTESVNQIDSCHQLLVPIYSVSLFFMCSVARS